MTHLTFRSASVALLIACSLGAAIEASGQTQRLRREVADERWAARGEVAVTPISESGNHLRLIGQEDDPLDSPTSDGVAWLQANQNPSGSWGGLFEFVDTCTVVKTLADADPGGDELAGGAAWLRVQAASNYEYLARQVVGLAGVAGYEGIAANLADELLVSRNPAEWDDTLPNWPEGGWGVADGYETDCLTTALALLALEATGFNGGFTVTEVPLAAGTYNIHEWDIPDDATQVNIYITVTGTTVHLRMAEGSPPMSGMGFTLPPGNYWIAYPDAGLPFTPGHNYIVIQDIGGAAGSYTMTAAYVTPTFDTLTLAEPLDYLREAQNVDGGWGLQRGQDTEFYTTLHVLLALLKYSNYDTADAIADGIDYVKSQQLGDGSFGYAGTPISYVTALAALGLIGSESYPFSGPTEDAIAALLAMQDVDGSWDQGSYHTALGVRALWEHNQTPTVDAGAYPVFLDEDDDGGEDVPLSGSASDVDGWIDSYVWTEGGEEIATGPSPTVTLSLGTHEITLTVTDNQGKPASDTVTIQVAQMIYETNMDSDPGWTTEGLWAWGVPQGNDGWHGGVPPDGPDPTSGCTEANVYGYNLNGGYEDNLPPTYLTTPAVDCTGYSNVRLRFCRWLCVEGSLYDHASLEISNDGSNWDILYDHSGGTFVEDEWSEQDYDISAFADGQTTVFVRWVMGPTDYTWNYGGWNIDDVLITGVPPVSSSPIIVSSTPSDGYIDPRNTSGGIDQISITFDQPVRNTDGSALSPDAFTITSTSGGSPPTVVSVDDSGNPTVILTLSGSIEVQHWTTITANVENSSGAEAITEMDIGFLPCDVDQSGCVNISDATAFVVEFNGLQRIELIDTNRSGNVNISDATEFANLFGDGWSGECLPPQP